MSVGPDVALCFEKTASAVQAVAKISGNGARTAERRVGARRYLALLPAWPAIQPDRASAPCRAAVIALAASVARQFSSHAALRRPLAGGGRVVVAADVAALDAALEDYARTPRHACAF